MTMTTTTTLNGTTIDLPAPTPLVELLKRQNVQPQDAGIAVAVNGTVVRRALWDATMIQPGDRIEVVHARQGG